MKENEPIFDMIIRFIDIVNGFDRKFTNSEFESKMLMSLSDDWSSLRILIENTKDIDAYLLEERYGTLMTYEINRTKIKEKIAKSKEGER